VKQLDLFGQARSAPARSAPPVDPPDPELPDAVHRARIRQDLSATLFVEAAAGTGKTSELVRRIIAVLVSGRAALGQTVALTFTDKAAGELKLRLREEIERERHSAADALVQRRLDAALGELEVAQIGTIHSFCAELLRERPVEAGVDPLFETAAEDSSELLLDEAFDSWFQRSLAAPPEGVRRLLRRRHTGRDASGPRAMMRAAVGRLVEHRDFPQRWKRPERFDRAAACDQLLAGLGELAELSRQASAPDDYLARSLREVARFVDEEQTLEAARGRDYDGVEARLRDLQRQRLWGWKGKPSLQRFAPDVSRDDVLSRRAEVQRELELFFGVADADLAALLQAELQPVVDEYERLKAHSGALDFLDLLLRARDLVRDNGAVRAELQRRFTHFLVDEFQDTDPLQAELLLLLAADDPAISDWRAVRIVPGKLFLVGDPKQSIYRFRRADVGLYETVKRQLVGQGAEVIPLEASFRSVPAIQSAINAAFAPAMGGEATTGQARYVPLRRVRPDVEGQPAVIALPVPRPYAVGWSKPGVTLRQIETSYPDAVGALIHWLVLRSGWSVSERDREERVPIEPRHVCLLFRRFSGFGEDMTRPYVRALEARHIPHVVVGGRSFHSREEVLALRNALTAIEWPDDELSVFATLRGPLVALSDDQLLAFRHRVGRLHPLQRVDLEALQPPEREVAEALALFGGLYPGRNRRSVAATVMRLLEGLRAHATFATWPTGEQALANTLQFLDLARRFEGTGATSFRAFVERLEQAAEEGRAHEAPVVEEGTEGVRMMTVHKAKGLEFPVVVLVDPTARLTPATPSRHVDPARRLWAEPLAGCCPLDLLDAAEEELRRDEQEEVRLAYVAASRARDLLVVPTIGDEHDLRPSWLDVLTPAVYPSFERQRQPARAPGCPAFGPESVLDRPGSVDALPDSSVAPGLHAPRAGEHSVVWWGPGELELDVEHEVGQRQQQFVEAAESGASTDEARLACDTWRDARAAARAAGGRPQLLVDAVTRYVRAQAEAPPPAVPSPRAVEVERVAVDRVARPSGKRFGTLVHAVLAVIDLRADPATIAATASTQGRMLGATDDEIEVAARVVRAALAHPLLRRAASAPEVRREAPLMLCLPDGTLLEGIADLALRELTPAGGVEWTVVDFKTDQEIEPHLAVYEQQVQLYVEAVARSTGGAVRGVILVV
jgi:ATP-dependent helicase/nuclease subunit A